MVYVWVQNISRERTNCCKALSNSTNKPTTVNSACPQIKWSHGILGFKDLEVMWEGNSRRKYPQSNALIYDAVVNHFHKNSLSIELGMLNCNLKEKIWKQKIKFLVFHSMETIKISKRYTAGDHVCIYCFNKNKNNRIDLQFKCGDAVFALKYFERSRW